MSNALLSDVQFTAATLSLIPSTGSGQGGRAARQPEPVQPQRDDPGQVGAEESRAELTVKLLTQAWATDGTERHELRERVVLMHLDVARTVAARYRNRGQDQQDLLQVAHLGLVQAVERFDPARGAFLAYAVPTMVGSIKRYFRDHSWAVRPPRELQEHQAEITAAKDDLTQVLRRSPTVTDLADHLRLGEQQVRAAQRSQACFSATSLDAPSYEGGASVGDQLGDCDQDLDRLEAALTLRAAFASLPARDRRLLYLRFVQDCSQEEIGLEFAVSQMQVSRWLRRTLGRLREAIGELEPISA